MALKKTNPFWGSFSDPQLIPNIKEYTKIHYSIQTYRIGEILDGAIPGYFAEMPPAY